MRMQKLTPKQCTFSIKQQALSTPVKSYNITMTTLALLILSLSVLFPSSLSQHQLSPPVTMAFCGPLLLPLVPCAPFVQGIATSPTQPCCNSLSQLYIQQPSCLCMFLNNNSALSTFPINTTLSSELPTLCSLQANNTALCSGEAAPANPTAPAAPANPPASQTPSGSHPNSTIAASPAVTATPRTSILGYSRSEGMKLKIDIQWITVIAAYLYM